MTIVKRKKQPEKVRRLLLDAAARIATERGIADVTVDAVCLEAGVTKGAFFHHYPSKAALISSVFDDLIERFEADIEHRMADDDEIHGRFSRAYISAVTATDVVGNQSLWAALCVSAVADAGIRELWTVWLESHLVRHGEKDDRRLRIARAAADGLWLDTVAGTAASTEDLKVLITDLHLMTCKATP